MPYPPQRLRRFFVEVDGSYRINKSLREMCVFASHNVLADPPFSRVDLCRASFTSKRSRYEPIVSEPPSTRKPWGLRA